MPNSDPNPTQIVSEAIGLETAVGSGDYGQIYKLSHKIKPNVDLLGMEDTRALALEMETMGKNEENLDGIRERFPRFKQDVEQVISELKNDFGV